MSNRILIIEDDTAIAQVLRLNLECADYTVTAFDNGLAAWNALAADHDYDLALLDMMLPGVDGFTLLPKLQEYGIPVICLTAMNDAQHEVQGLRGGAEDYIAKPFDMLALMVRMEKVLRRSGKFNEIYHFRDLTLDNGNRRLSRNGEEIPLPPLDGYHVVNDLIFKGRFQLSKNAFRIGMMIVLVLSAQGILGRIISWVVYPAQGLLLAPIRAIWG